ncbi:hypothetical protein L873DRAFT_1797730 [Choiromyces venosus 120613-1]|uniref:Rhodopsin domain-containing protein n=1 Tax=Choiromyces venosus 120613-1 TaxID=1336337 RepID=A0A3N4KAF1_9PEZI|nr:hypothetical protein L873DRAFT_1797730 [Choiromyces venosus 120613-1]
MTVSPEGMIGILWFFVAFDATFLAIRFYLITTRPRVTIAAFASEACIFTAFLLFLFETSSTTVYQAMLIKYRHDPTIPKALGMPRETLIRIFKFQLAEVEMYLTGVWLVKGSFLALYFDIFRSLPPGIRKMLQFTTIYTMLTWFTNFLLPLVYCRPLSLVWSIEHHCTSFRSKLGTTFPMVTNVTTDLLIMIIPILVLRTLNLRKSEMLAIAFLLSLGCLTIIASLLRYAYVTKRNALGKSGSPNLVTQAQIWSYAEGCIATFAACLPAGRVLLARRKLRNTSGGSSSGRGHSGFSSKMNRIRKERLPGNNDSGEHGLVVFKTTSFGVESTAELTQGRAGPEGGSSHGPQPHGSVELRPI